MVVATSGAPYNEQYFREWVRVISDQHDIMVSPFQGGDPSLLRDVIHELTHVKDAAASAPHRELHASANSSYIAGAAGGSAALGAGALAYLKRSKIVSEHDVDNDLSVDRNDENKPPGTPVVMVSEDF
eukprot:Blabericola_migrator_1__10090@NODE_55_length_16001_cov_154_094327_g51_i0_p12_GENE_NODE_55_length_16001_cov_154_094327_g51_i0NODE_55_length_16001_cov_154_094327_g51_i0_p12_ORF_typecomplete_len128_score16_79Gram_pos_anchor/PF00746_21/0_056_NODE_55_length_16001_cov_154_094327_g51_i01315513538